MQSYRQYCPVAKAHEILGDRWTMLIVRELVAGLQNFNEIARGLPGISRSLLSERLLRLEAITPCAAKSTRLRLSDTALRSPKLATVGEATTSWVGGALLPGVTEINLQCQLAEIVDAVGDRIDVICDGGITRGTHVLKALSLGAKACSGGRLYLYALAAAGQAGVEKALGNLRAEIERDMKLMGARSVDQLSRDNLKFR